jgi:hypothetical protein
MGMDYRNEKIISFLESIGYTQRVGNYYVIAEIDGYINVNYFKTLSIIDDGQEIINFHKNFYSQNRYAGRKDISETFHNFDDFFRYMLNYHRKSKEVRKLKLKKLEELNT